MLNQVWMEVLHQIILIAIQLVVFSLVFLLRRSVTFLQNWLNHHATLTERAVIQQIGHEAFVFAEAAFRNHAGEKKLEQALAYGAELARRKGIPVTVNEIRSAVERAVMEANTAN